MYVKKLHDSVIIVCESAEDLELASKSFRRNFLAYTDNSKEADDKLCHVVNRIKEIQDNGGLR